MKKYILVILFFIVLFSFVSSANAQKATVGTYYFEGWVPGDTWHMTQNLLNYYTNREPIWGWTDNSVTIMQQQIDLAADNGISFFAFDWYMKDNSGSFDIPATEALNINQGINNYMQANNKSRLKFALLVDNHNFPINGTAEWKQVADYWMKKYFTDPQYMRTAGKPLLFIFNSSNGDASGFQYLEQLAQQNGLPGIAIVDTDYSKVTSGDLYPYYTLTSTYLATACYSCGHVEQSYTTLYPAFGYDSRPAIPLVDVGFDKRPWEGDPPAGEGMAPGYYYDLDHTPQQFGNFLQQAVTWMDNNSGQTTPERLMMIYAWNENGEGGYLMPTQGDPNGAFLSEIKTVIGGYSPTPTPTPTPISSPTPTPTPTPTPAPTPSPAPTLPGWTFCANENQTCSFNGTKLVQYGANSQYYTQTLTNGTLCANSVFGDSAVGTVKYCYYQNAIAKTGDLNNDGKVDVTDLGILLSNWGSTAKPAADLNQDGYVNVTDLGILLSNWG